MAEGFKIDQRHGKSRVRVARVWRPHNRRSSDVRSGGDHVMVEWEVDVSLFSDCLPSYTSDDNSSIVATDSMKNTVNRHPPPPSSSSLVSKTSLLDPIVLAGNFIWGTWRGSICAWTCGYISVSSYLCIPVIRGIIWKKGNNFDFVNTYKGVLDRGGILLW